MLKHLVQLAEYVTGMSARIGYPTEHLTRSKIEEVKHPMHATGIGLLIKGIEDQESKMADVPAGAMQAQSAAVGADGHEEMEEEQKATTIEDPRNPKSGWFERLKQFFVEDDSDLK